LGQDSKTGDSEEDVTLLEMTVIDFHLLQYISEDIYYQRERL
jgi:hypothetical protein